MSIRIAINGYGRIGRCILRALYETGKREKIEIVAINELANLSSIAHLTQFDSIHGQFRGDVGCDGKNLLVNGDCIRMLCEPDIALLPWDEIGIDLVLECSGSYVERDMAEQHLESGAGKVLFSCPALPDVDATVVYGLNHHQLRPEHTIVSNASCTTNCIAHIIQLLHNTCTIECGTITTTHSMMNDQPVIDAYHNPDLRKNRSSGNSIIPVDTGLARGLERIFPGLRGCFQAISLRVPTMNVSLMQLTAQVASRVDAKELNGLFKEAAMGPLQGILGYTDLPLVSCDFNHDSRSAIVDSSQTSVSGDCLVNVMAWFDNEWGYANRMLDTTMAMMGR
ncbi:glyceraldehyde 3-phosphate dehydrogenase NAD-binding domain-containing protein [Desulfogranum japonicum]|uniref:glyceraldehyde 3-phosphate dehydrogenase NAD-binding domain-containing protein n=1 Tax=Desulfogranum japonicum TaxID=231447 RepID=UPI00048C6EF7|nr:glyceraldehyde 3-phosphate dehydrogenase NAD-binding domain-containing protein [Desulfogranum japonicum]